MTDITCLPPVNLDDAKTLADRIDQLVSQISAHELRLARSYARLGGLLREVKNSQYWIPMGYDRFSSYLENIRKRLGRERSQVYEILSVAETLLPLVSESELEAVGVTKAHELKRFVKEGGNIQAYVEIPLDPSLLPAPGLDQRPADEALTVVRLMDYASDPKVTAKQLRVKINELLHVHEGPKGNWYEPSGFYATTEERKEIEDFWDTGKKLFCPSEEQPEFTWKKEVFLAAVRECLGQWVTEVEGV